MTAPIGYGVALAALVALAGACDDEFPAPLNRSTVRGTVTYGGSAHEQFSRPAVQVVAFYSFPPATAPNSLHVSDSIAGLDGDGVTYELQDLVSFDYYVLAQLVDLDNRDDLTVPAGAFPDFCALSAPQAPVVVGDGETVEQVDFELFDAAGSTDPCSADPSVCPEPALSTLVVNVESAVAAADIAPEDSLLVGLFDQFPPTGLPVTFSILPSSQVEFPQVVKYTNVPPGEYALYVCLDIGGDNLASLCGDGDVWAVFDGGAQILFEDGKVTTVDINIDDGTGMSMSQDASDFLCE